MGYFFIPLNSTIQVIPNVSISKKNHNKLESEKSRKFVLWPWMLVIGGESQMLLFLTKEVEVDTLNFNRLFIDKKIATTFPLAVIF